MNKSYIMIPLVIGTVIGISILYKNNGVVNKKEIVSNIKKETVHKEDKEQKMPDTTKTTSTITRTDSGLGYKILTEPTSDGKSPVQGQTVQVHYTGWLDDNGQTSTKFDSSVDRGTPFEFPVGLGYVIKGWDEAVLDMKVGEKRRIYLPSELGYGARGAGGAIPPNADLIFDVEFLAIK